MMGSNLDRFEERQRKIRGGWSGNGPEPGTPAFGEQARERRERIRGKILAEKPVSVQGRAVQLEQREERDKKILEDAGE